MAVSSCFYMALDVLIIRVTVIGTITESKLRKRTTVTATRTPLPPSEDEQVDTDCDDDDCDDHSWKADDDEDGMFSRAEERAVAFGNDEKKMAATAIVAPPAPVVRRMRALSSDARIAAGSVGVALQMLSVAA
eukprot:EC788315.1.p1 GENE.EC788315.1~~EC788315.1.p1  ORF type:complete len:133 (+),score=28.90 EC788315.1:49-447(+)